MIGNGAVEGGLNVRVAEVDLGELDRGLGVQHVRRRLIGLGLPFLHRRLAREILPGERRLSLIFGLVVFLRRLVGGERGVRLIELLLVGVALDAEELGSFFHFRAVDIVDRFQKALDARHEIDGGERLRVAGELEIVGDRFLDGLRHDDLRRRRRDIGVAGIAARERDRAHRNDSRPNREPARIVQRTKLLHERTGADPESVATTMIPPTHRRTASR